MAQQVRLVVDKMLDMENCLQPQASAVPCGHQLGH
jgi:hypothetical protein